MTHQPPIDQRIVDDFFKLSSNGKAKGVGWLYGMVATYGLKPEELLGFTWGDNSSIHVKDKKRPVPPLHPQWVLLFELKEKQPRTLRSCWESLHVGLCQAMAYQHVSLNITDLLLAHKLRKSHYRVVKQKKEATPVFAGVS